MTFGHKIKLKPGLKPSAVYKITTNELEDTFETKFPELKDYEGNDWVYKLDIGQHCLSKTFADFTGLGGEYQRGSLQ